MFALDALGRLALGQAGSASANALTADVGAFTMTGVDAVFNVTMPAEVGAFAYTGVAAGLVITMPAEVGAFTLTGQTALTPASYVLACNPFLAQQETQFGFAPLGAVAFGQGYVDVDTSITYEVVGADLGVVLRMSADVGAFALTGNAANLVEGNVLTADAGALALAFQSVATSLTLPLAAGAFTVSGQGPSTELARRSPKLRRFPRIGTTAISARSVGTGMRARAYGG